MVIAVLTPVRLFAESLSMALQAIDPAVSVLISGSFSQLRATLAGTLVDIALIDVGQETVLDEVRELSAHWPTVAFLALGLNPHQKDVVRCARAGFASYVPHGASMQEFQQILQDVVAGHLRCGPNISAALFRALCSPGQAQSVMPVTEALTARECDVLRELGYGHANKEIARTLGVSISTIKHHVHRILEKLNIRSRAEAMRKVRDTPWMLGPVQVNGTAHRRADKGDLPIWTTIN